MPVIRLIIKIIVTVVEEKVIIILHPSFIADQTVAQLGSLILIDRSASANARRIVLKFFFGL